MLYVCQKERQTDLSLDILAINFSAASSRAKSETLALHSANALAAASPIPRLAPVMKTVFPDKSIAFLTFAFSLLSISFSKHLKDPLALVD